MSSSIAVVLLLLSSSLADLTVATDNQTNHSSRAASPSTATETTFSVGVAFACFIALSIIFFVVRHFATQPRYRYASSFGCWNFIVSICDDKYFPSFLDWRPVRYRVLLVYKPSQIASGQVSKPSIESFAAVLRAYGCARLGGKVETEVLSEEEYDSQDHHRHRHRQHQAAASSSSSSFRLTVWHVMPYFADRYITDKSRRFVELVICPTDTSKYESIPVDRESGAVLLPDALSARSYYDAVWERMSI